MSTAPDRLAVLDDFTLDSGSHRGGIDSGACLLELTSYIAGEPWSDEPECVSPVLTAYGIGLNDAWDDEQRQKLKPFIPRMIGTAGDGQDEARSFLALDWLIRTYTPTWLDLAGFTVEAAALRDHPPIVDDVAARSVSPVVLAARKKAATSATARAETLAATGIAAWDAAAAGIATWDAIWPSTADPARAAAEHAAAAAAAAGESLAPTVTALQESALDLFDAMIDPSAAVTA